jgi:hypothetical protein
MQLWGYRTVDVACAYQTTAKGSAETGKTKDKRYGHRCPELRHDATRKRGAADRQKPIAILLQKLREDLTRKTRKKSWEIEKPSLP